jgi:hypothetical protein
MGNAQYRHAAGAIICNEEGKLLVGQRSKVKKVGVGTVRLKKFICTKNISDHKILLFSL